LIGEVIIPPYMIIDNISYQLQLTYQRRHS